MYTATITFLLDNNKIIVETKSKYILSNININHSLLSLYYSFPPIAQFIPLISKYFSF